jgi:hypothetical protein
VIKLVLVAIAVWLALMPPLFTAGACTREFDDETARVARDVAKLRTPETASRYWTERNVPHAVVPVEQCRRAKPRWLQSCGGGPIIHARVPVRNLVCGLYRDDEIRVRLFYDERDRLAQTQFDMNPYKSLPLVGGITLHWAR